MAITKKTQSSTPLYKLSPVAACVVLLLSACGGSSSSSDGGSTATTADTSESLSALTPEPIDAPLNDARSGTIVVEERGGRIVYDGWFNNTDAALSDSWVTPIGEDTCRVVDDPAVLASLPAQKVSALYNREYDDALHSPTLAAANEFSSVGQSISIDSRVGQFDSLHENTLGDTTVYAQEERWQSKALPDDAMIGFESLTDFSKLGSVQVSPLRSLVWIAPENGIMSGASTALQWEASFDDESQVNIRLSAVDYSHGDEPKVVTVSCKVVDDGTFTLPANFQQALPEHHSGIVVYAVRERVKQVNGDGANLTLRQLSYPDPY